MFAAALYDPGRHAVQTLFTPRYCPAAHKERQTDEPALFANDKAGHGEQAADPGRAANEPISHKVQAVKELREVPTNGL